MNGLRPVAEMMTINFALLASDQIINGMAKVHYMFNGQFRCPMVLRATGGAGRQLGATHSQNLEVMFAHVPGLKVVAPSMPRDAKGLLKAAIRSDDPVVFVEHAALYPTRGEVPDGEVLEEIGKSQVKRQGKDVTIIAYSKPVLTALEAAAALAQDGIEAEVIDLRTLRPLDMAPIVESFKKTNRAVIVEEGWGTYGVGAEVAARLYAEGFDYLDAPIKRVAQLEVPLPYNRTLEQMALPQVADVIAAVKELV
jgi:pyruvate dehydrogenase E1 component beta subunit